MVDQCVACETDDELLFTCSYCSEQFCPAHQFPHHACEGFGRAGEASDPPDAPTETGGDDPSVPGDDPQPVTVTPPGPSPRAKSLSAGGWGGPGNPPVGASEGVVDVRPMDSRRVVGGTEASAAPRTVGDWIDRQTYLTLTVKVGVVALLVNSAFYGGVALTLYGLLPFVL